MLAAAFFTRAKMCPSVEEWVKRMWYIYSTEYCSATRKKESLPFVTVWVNLEGMILSDISQTETDKYRVVPLMCGT